ncbi:hypothetical protein [Achromobacter sp. RW408]|uniref:hypothetical protein n=1 Tax=Achromobacter sp. RW408 TaxID=2202897 RepID=UPI0011B6D198|nr:hypothetical protein [Achromobacter sp. RW408]
MAAFIEFVWDVGKRGWKWATFPTATVFAALTYFDTLQGTTPLTKTLTGVGVVLLGALCGVLRGAYLREAAIRADIAAISDSPPLTVRLVKQGDVYYEGRMIIILDKAPWLERGLLLSLTNEVDSITPVALLYVETFTSDDYPQCIVWRGYQSAEDLWGFLRDQSRWKSLQARRNVRIEHLENANHD